MNSKRYQLWMRLMYYHPGNPIETRTQGRANFRYRIIDTQAADLRAQQDQVLEDGYSFWGHSEDASHLENFARVTMQDVQVAIDHLQDKLSKGEQ